MKNNKGLEMLFRIKDAMFSGNGSLLASQLFLLCDSANDSYIIDQLIVHGLIETKGEIKIDTSKFSLESEPSYAMNEQTLKMLWMLESLHLVVNIDKDNLIDIKTPTWLEVETIYEDDQDGWEDVCMDHDDICSTCNGIGIVDCLHNCLYGCSECNDNGYIHCCNICNMK